MKLSQRILAGFDEKQKQNVGKKKKKGEGGELKTAKKGTRNRWEEKNNRN